MDSIHLAVRATTEYQLSTECFLLMIVEPPLQGEQHRVTRESLITTPTQFASLDYDAFGNPLRRLVAPPGLFRMEFVAEMDTRANQPVPDGAPEVLVRELPPDLLVFTLPSRYVQSDHLQRMAMDEFGNLAPGGSRVNAIASWIRRHVEYRYGTTDGITSAFDTATQRVGVCRDFAHLMAAFCRALGIATRYVSGYCLDLQPPDFHAWVQVYLGGRWHNVDATFANLRPALVPIAFGRDAADVAMVTLWGQGELNTQEVAVRQR